MIKQALYHTEEMKIQHLKRCIATTEVNGK